MTGEPATRLPERGPAGGGSPHDLWRRYLCPSRSPIPWGPAPVGWEEACALDDDDDYGSPFFLSYAHVTGDPAGPGEALDPDGLVSKFFYDLVGNVVHMIPPRAGVPAGFMDRRMRPGVQWTGELLHAAGTCQILVALLSASYLESKWCRMEWHAFSLREVRRAAGAKVSPRQGCIVPVIWAPIHFELPEHIQLTEIFSPTYEPEPQAPGHYERYGVAGLMKMHRLSECYEIVMWQLAMHIAHIYHNQRTEHRKFEVEELRGVLEDECHDS
jgi:hypothetical protein